MNAIITDVERNQIDKGLRGAIKRPKHGAANMLKWMGEVEQRLNGSATNGEDVAAHVLLADRAHKTDTKIEDLRQVVDKIVESHSSAIKELVNSHNALAEQVAELKTQLADLKEQTLPAGSPSGKSSPKKKSVKKADPPKA